MKQNTALFPYAVSYDVLADGGEVDTPFNLGLTLNRNCIIIPSISFLYVVTTVVGPPPGPGGPLVMNFGFLDGDNLGALVTNIEIDDLVAGAVLPLTPTDPFQPNANQTRFGCSVTNPTPAGTGLTAGRVLLIVNTQNISMALSNA